jgi:hypothetical protein
MSIFIGLNEVFMSVEAVKWVRDLRYLSGNQKTVMFVIGEHADEDGENSFPSLETIASESGVSVRTAQRVIAELSMFGLLSYEGRKTKWGKTTSHMFTVPINKVTPIACETRLKKVEAERKRLRKLESQNAQLTPLHDNSAINCAGLSSNSADLAPSINHPLIALEPTIEPGIIFLKNKTEKEKELTPAEKERRERWAAGQWIDENDEIEMNRYIKSLNREGLPDWAKAYNDQQTKLMEELRKEYGT